MMMMTDDDGVNNTVKGESHQWSPKDANWITHLQCKPSGGRAIHLATVQLVAKMQKETARLASTRAAKRIDALQL